MGLFCRDNSNSACKANPADAIAPFTQPGLITIPLAFAVLVLVSLATKPQVRSKDRFAEATN